jgi:hypothetical protein
VRWHQQTTASYGDAETWYARYRGWTLYAHRMKKRRVWYPSVHRFTGGGADDARSVAIYGSPEGAQNAAEFYAEHGRWPHA